MNLLRKITPQKIINIYHLFQAILAGLWYGFPSKEIKVIGVTGTNGKTTTCQMIAKILEEAGHKVAMISTINFKLGDKEWVNDTKYTTFSSFKLQKFIKQAVKANCQYIIIETSSHSLDQYRVWGTDYDTAVITNVTREHLDYHKTMDKYRKAKSLLFKSAKAAIINLDMENPEEFLNYGAKNIYGFTLKDRELTADKQKTKIIKAENIQLGIDKSEFIVYDSEFIIHLPGSFNIENALAATCVGLAYGIDSKIIAEALEKIKSVSGRMEYISNNKGINIIVDYAVTPDSLSKLYALMEQINTNKAKVIAVFGACGERDRGKRPIMGEIVSHYANYLILTNEDPYNEDPWQIINEVEAGIKNKKLEKDYWKILDRREAIKKALALAGPGDFVIVTGKGAEETMAIRNKRIPWNDKKIIQEALQEL